MQSKLDAPLFGLDAPFITTTLNNASLSDINFKSPLLENHRGMTNVSSYAEIPFTSKSQGSIKRIYYPGAKVDTINNIKIATDVNTDPNRITYIKKRKLFFDKNVNKTFEKGVDVLAYNIELYFSKDAIKLKECFKVTKTEPNGIIFFIEDNTDDISAQFCRIKIGNRVRDNLKHESQLYSNKKVLDYINEYVSIDKAVLEELIRNKKIENVSLKSVEFLFAANDYLNPYALDKKLIAVLGKVCGSIAKFIDKAKLDKHRWNPDVKKLKDDGTVDQTHTFKPFLFPFIEEGLDTVPDHKLNDYAIKAFTELQTGFYKQDAKIRQYVQQTDFGKLATVPITIAGIPFTAMTPLEIDLIPDSLERYVFSKYIQISDAIQSTFKQLEQFDFTDLIKKGVRIANAYLCGIWNGLIDAISGIFKMLEMLFNAIVTMQDFTANFSTQFPLLMEYVDNAIVAIKNIDFKALYTHLKGKLSSITNISIETIAYFSGAFVGFVVSLAIEVVVGILFTGGTLSVAAVLEKLATVFSGIFRGIANAGRAVFNYTKKIIITTFKSFTKLLDELIAFLNKSNREFKKLIDDVFESTNKKIDDVFTGGKKLSKGGGDPTKSFAENHDIKIRKFISEGKVFGQSTGHTCVATSLKMILDEKGIIRTEEYLAAALKTDLEGASILDIPDALYNSYIEDIIAIPLKDIKFTQLLDELKEGEKAIVSLYTKKFGGHAVILEKVEHGKVFLIDPLPVKQGSSYSINIEDFQELFNDKATILK